MIVNIKNILMDARKNGYAIGAFNIFNYISAFSVVKAAEEIASPVIIQTSVSTLRQIGVKQIVRLLKNMAEDTDIPVAIHLDHCTDPEIVKQCIDNGWSSVMIDLSEKDFKTNIKITKEIVDYARKYNVSVEGELGKIGGIEDDIIVENMEETLATPESSLQFIKSTGIDAFAPAIGTSHGVYKGEPNINFELFNRIAKITQCALVIHGGTGLSPDVFKKLISLGASKINISTAIKVAYCQGLNDYINKYPNEYNPLKIDNYVFKKMVETIKSHIQIFGSAYKV